MRKILLLVCFLLLISRNTSIGGEIFNLEMMKETLNIYKSVDNIYEKYETNDFSEKAWKEHGLLVIKENAYKDKFNIKSLLNRQEYKEIFTRFYNNSRSFLGTTPEEYLVENPDYPSDTGKINQFITFDWTFNSNVDTSLLEKIEKIEDEDERQEKLDFYWNLIDSSFSREYSKYYFSDQVSEKMKQDILNAAILVYPIAEVPRHMISFRHSGERYEVTAFTEREFQLPPPEVTTKEESIPSLPIATQSKGNTLLIGSNQPGAEIFSNAYVYAVKREEVQSKKLDKGKVTLEPKQGYGVAAYPNQTN